MMLNKLFEKEIVLDKFPLSDTKLIDSINLQAKQERTKLWELDHNYHCAVIGTCLTLEEVKKLLRSFYVNVDDSSSYDIHTAIVTMISFHDFRSKKVQSYLNKKFKAAIHKTRKMNAAELKNEWNRVVNNGELIATFWAVITHPETSEKMKRDFYGDIHMQSHMSGASNRVDLRRLNSLEKKQKKIDIETKTQQAKYQKLQGENARLQKIIQQQTEKTTDLINHVAALTNANEQLTILKNVDEIDQLNSQQAKLMHKIDFQADEIKRYEKEQQHMNRVIADLNHQISTYEKTITEYNSEIEYLQYLLSQNKADDKCPLKKQGLCGQCVLYVGGKTSLIPYYRELVEAKSGIFLHHDGGIEKNTQDLSCCLSRADLVIFPSNCISHDAYWKIKRICKKQQKPFEYLKNPGLHSLSSMLDQLVTKPKAVDIYDQKIGV